MARRFMIHLSIQSIKPLKQYVRVNWAYTYIRTTGPVTCTSRSLIIFPIMKASTDFQLLIILVDRVRWMTIFRRRTS